MSRKYGACFAKPLIFAGFAALFFAGCSKLAVYEPGEIEASFGYSDRLNAPIAAKTADGATLENGEILTAKAGAIDRIEEGFTLLSIDGRYALAADRSGVLNLYFGKNKTHSFPQKDQIASASTDGQIITVITTKNAVKIIEINTAKTLFFSQQKTAIAVQSPIAKPLIAVNRVIAPTLDGKLLIIDRASMSLSREIVVSAEDSFANVTFLAEYEGFVVASSGSKVVSIAAAGAVRTRDIDVRLVALLASGFYIFSRDGTVMKVAGTLDTLALKRLDYARFAAAAEKNGEIWAVEQSGFAVRFSDNLRRVKVYSLPDSIREHIYADSDGFWQYEKLVRWQ